MNLINHIKDVVGYFDPTVNMISQLEYTKFTDQDILNVAHSIARFRVNNDEENKDSDNEEAISMVAGVLVARFMSNPNALYAAAKSGRAVKVVQAENNLLIKPLERRDGVASWPYGDPHQSIRYDVRLFERTMSVFHSLNSGKNYLPEQVVYDSKPGLEIL